jgi:hypothetical protein
MEDSLDKIAKGDATLVDVCASCNQEVDTFVDRVTNTKYEYELDANNTFMIGKYGPVIKCVDEKDGKEEITFKAVRKDVNISKLEKGEYGLDDIVASSSSSSNQPYILGEYEGVQLTLRKGKYGLYAAWGDKTRNLKELGNRPIENIALEEVVQLLNKGSSVIREISSNLSIRRGPKGNYLFYKTPAMKKPLFYDIKSFGQDYQNCDIHVLTSWINSTYSINP